MDQYPKTKPLEKKHYCPECKEEYSDIEVNWTPFGWECMKCGYRHWSFSERKREENQGVAGRILIEKKKKNRTASIYCLFREFSQCYRLTPEAAKSLTKKKFDIESLKNVSEEKLKEMEKYLVGRINEFYYPNSV
jgi:uncharacterized protein YjhX (UPF0386 family)